MSDKIIAAIITSVTSIVVVFISFLLTQNMYSAGIILAVCFLVASLFLYFFYFRNNKQKKEIEKYKNNEAKIKQDLKELEQQYTVLNEKNQKLVDENQLLEDEKIGLENIIQKEKERFQQDSKKIKEDLKESNATIEEINKYLSQPQETNPDIIQTTIKQHHYLSSEPTITFNEIKCEVRLQETAKPKLFNTYFKWIYNGKRSEHCNSFSIDIFSTTEFSDDFEKYINIRYKSANRWFALEKDVDYYIIGNKGKNHKTITIELGKTRHGSFDISIEYTLNENYDFKLPQETFIFMPFVYSNARNHKFSCVLDMGKNAEVDKAIVIKSANDEELTYEYDEKEHMIINMACEYRKTEDFKNVTINILHK